MTSTLRTDFLIFGIPIGVFLIPRLPGVKRGCVRLDGAGVALLICDL
jgi:hypothetical protein